MYRIGIDLGGTNIVAAVVDEDYTIVSRAACKTALPRSAEEIVSDMARMAMEAVEKAGLTMKDIKSVGVGTPGNCNRETGIVERAGNLGFRNLPLQAMLEEEIGRAVLIENDANAAAFGEYLAGSGKDVNSCVCITLGTGVGGGVILDGRIFTGDTPYGCELGHIITNVDGEPCTCGRRGCWEAYSSATALINQTKAAMQAHPESRLWEVASTLDEVNGKTAFDAKRLGDPVATEVVDYYIRQLAAGLTNVINVFLPAVLCIGGGICNEGEALLAPLNEIIARERYSKDIDCLTVLKIAELGNDAGIIGAAFLDKTN